MCKERIKECQDLIASLVTICKMSLFFLLVNLKVSRTTKLLNERRKSSLFSIIDVTSSTTRLRTSTF